jgi:cytochrome c biogenesis protein
LFIYNETRQFLGNIELNETVNFNQPITLLEIISSTGLQIKTDPGIPIIYLGFFFLMLSTLISYITYSQIWIIQKNQKFLLVEIQIVLFLNLN